MKNNHTQTLIENNYNLSVMKALFSYLKSLYNLKTSKVEIANHFNPNFSFMVSLEEIDYEKKILKKSPSLVKRVSYYKKNYSVPENKLYDYIDTFILENIRLDIDSEVKDSILTDNAKLLVMGVDDLTQYVLIGIYSIHGSISHDTILHDTDTIEINGESKNLFEEIRNIPMSEFLQYYDSLGFKYLPIIELKNTLKGIKLNLNIDFTSIVINPPEDDSKVEEKQFLVGIENTIFNNALDVYLREEKLLGVSSKNNTAWEEE